MLELLTYILSKLFQILDSKHTHTPLFCPRVVYHRSQPLIARKLSIWEEVNKTSHHQPSDTQRHTLELLSTFPSLFQSSFMPPTIGHPLFQLNASNNQASLNPLECQIEVFTHISCTHMSKNELKATNSSLNGGFQLTLTNL